MAGPRRKDDAGGSPRTPASFAPARALLVIAALLLALLSLPAAAAAARAASPGWVLQRVAAPPLGAGGEMEAVAALDGDTAWVCGTGDTGLRDARRRPHLGGRVHRRAGRDRVALGVVHRRAPRLRRRRVRVRRASVFATEDGGVTWTERLRLPGAPLAGLAFWGTGLGWVAGQGGTISATTDAGAHWTLPELLHVGAAERRQLRRLGPGPGRRRARHPGAHPRRRSRLAARSARTPPAACWTSPTSRAASPTRSGGAVSW